MSNVVDLSQLTNAELLDLAAKNEAKNSLSNLSNEDLESLKKEKSANKIQEYVSRAKAGLSTKSAGKHYDTLAGPGFKLPYAMGVAGSAAEGILLGGSDEVGASVDSLRGRAPYNDALAIRRDQRKQFSKENPVVSTAAEIAGAIPTLALPFMSAAKGASLLGRVVKGASTAGAEGAVYGFNQGEGGAKNRSMNAALTGSISAPLGGLAPAAGVGIKNLYNRALTKKAANRLGISRPTYIKLKTALDADQALDGSGAANIQKAGPNAMLADAGPSTVQSLDAVANRFGPSGRVAQEAVNERAASSGRALTSRMNQILGQPRGPRATARDISQKTAPARAKAYDRAYSQPINYSSVAGRDIEAVLTKIPPKILQSAVEEANESMLAAGVKNQHILSRVVGDSFELIEMPNVQQLDEIKRALGAISSEVDNLGRPTAGANRAKKLARELKIATGNAVPDYLTAVRLGGDKIERDNALRLGREMLSNRTTREIVEEGVNDIGDNAEARDALKVGIRGFIDDTLANVKTAMIDGNMDAREAAVAVRMLSSRANKEKLIKALGLKDASILIKELDQASASLGIRAGIAQNSKTHIRNMMDDIDIRQTQDGFLNKARAGMPLDAPRQLWSTIMGRSPQRIQEIRDKGAKEMAVALTGRRGNDAIKFVNEISQASKSIGPTSEKARLLAELMARKNAAVVAPIRNRFEE